jgi:phosphatidylserine/phosphatidylglycerophosphate/cardiolipin synthase-like enzyme
VVDEGSSRGHRTRAHAAAEARDGSVRSGRLLVSLGMVVAFLLLEVVVGLGTSSLSLLSDAGHVLTDVVGMFMALVALELVRRGGQRAARTHGWHRAEVLTAVLTAALLDGVAVFILVSAVDRLVNPPAVPGPLLGLMVLPRAVNLGRADAALLRCRADDPPDAHPGAPITSSTPVRVGRILSRALGRSTRSLTSPREGFDPAHPWLLTQRERGNDATALRPWTTGSTARALVHGSTYFRALLDAVEAVGPGDLVLFTDWRGDADERLAPDGPTVSELFSAAAARGAVVRGLVWRSHTVRLGYTAERNRALAESVTRAGGEVVLDQRVLALGSHHQKLVVVRHARDPARDVAFVGGIDLAHGRRDDIDHGGDPQTRPFPDVYGPTPAWHDVQVVLSGPAVREVEECFRERWADPAPLARLPWHVVADLLRRRPLHEPSELPAPLPAPAATGTCEVQLLRTYPRRHPAYPFAPNGERSAARSYAKALQRARRLVYVEDQYLWSADVARVFAEALRRTPTLHLVVVVPRHPDSDGGITPPSALLGHAEALQIVRAAGGDRVLVLDVENHAGVPVYVHAKVCVVDDVWAVVGSDNFNRRSWTHDSELGAAVLDTDRDPRAPTDPGGLGDGARTFARALRLELLREHLDRAPDDDDDLLDPDDAVAAIAASAERLEAWHAGGRVGRRPPGRLRPHRVSSTPVWRRRLFVPVYRLFVDPDGRPFTLRLRRRF